jgi:hypothetical protein
MQRRASNARNAIQGQSSRVPTVQLKIPSWKKDDMPLRLSRKLEIVSLPLAVVIVILIGGIVYQNGIAFRQSRILEKRAAAAIRDVDSLRAGRVDAETGQRGYLLTGSDPWRW